MDDALPCALFGLRVKIRPTLKELGDLEVASGKEDVNVILGAMPEWFGDLLSDGKENWFISPEREEDGVPILRMWTLAQGAFYYFLYQDGTEFLIDRAGTNVWGRWLSPLTLEDAATYLLGPIFGFLLHIRGVLCLHASAIVVDGKAVALVGGAGMGKSTTAAAFAKLGFPVLTDDVLPLEEAEGQFLVQSGYPRLRLWPDSVEALFDSPEALPNLTPNWEKRYLDLSQRAYKFHRLPIPLGAIYLLSARQIDPKAPYVISLPPQQRVIGLVPNIYAIRLLNKQMRGKGFETLGRIASSIPVKMLVPSLAPDSQNGLCERVIEDYLRGKPSVFPMREN